MNNLARLFKLTINCFACVVLMTVAAAAQDNAADIARCPLPSPLSVVEKSNFAAAARQFIREESDDPTFLKTAHMRLTDFDRCLLNIIKEFDAKNVEDIYNPSEKKKRLTAELDAKRSNVFLQTFGGGGADADTLTLNAQIAWLIYNRRQAELMIAEALKIAPSHPEANFVRAFLNPNLPNAEKAVASNPKIAAAHRFKAIAQLEQAGKIPAAERQILFRAATQTIAQMLELPTSSPNAEFWRGQLEALDYYLKNSFPPAAAPPTAAPNAQTNGEAVSKLQITTKPPALYTEAARITQTDGTTRLIINLTADGTARNILVLFYKPFGLSREAVKTAKNIDFIPEKRDGKPVSTVRTIEYHFNIY